MRGGCAFRLILLYRAAAKLTAPPQARGPTATLLVQNGTLRTGDVVVCGSAYGKVRALVSDAGVRCAEAGPSMPVQMLGLDSVPCAGDVFDVVATEAEARERADSVRAQQLSTRLQEQSSGQSTLVSSGGAGGAGSEAVKRLNLIVKADVSGSLEAIKAALGCIEQEKVVLRFLMAAVGEVTGSDVDLAVASDAQVVAFNVPTGEDVMAKAKQKNVTMKSYDVIYALVDEVKAAMEALLQPVTEKLPLGEADVRGVFGGGASGKVAGCMVTQGKLVAKCQIAVRRGKDIVWEGKLDGLRRIKEVVKEVGQGLECGISSEYALWKASAQKPHPLSHPLRRRNYQHTTQACRP